MGMLFGDVVAHPLASQNLLSSCQYLLPFSRGMTGCREERFGYLPISWEIRLHDFWQKNNLRASAIHVYCGWILSETTSLIAWHCMKSADFRNSKWRTVNRKYTISLEWNGISPNFQQLPHIFDHARITAETPTLPNVGRLPQFKMADCKPEVHCISGLEWDITESAVTDVIRHQPTP